MTNNRQGNQLVFFTSRNNWKKSYSMLWFSTRKHLAWYLFVGLIVKLSCSIAFLGAMSCWRYANGGFTCWVHYCACSKASESTQMDEPQQTQRCLRGSEGCIVIICYSGTTDDHTQELSVRYGSVSLHCWNLVLSTSFWLLCIQLESCKLQDVQQMTFI